jgi:Zn-dependent peptidase ImmA (M78 family)
VPFEPILKNTEQINSDAESFLDSYHPSLSLPIPIEEIIDLQLEIDIIPVPGLKNVFEKAELDIDAFISSDFQSITVDRYIQEIVNNRYRFTLAHEIGHMILHGYVYSQLRFNKINEWIGTINNMPLGKRSIIEEQANEFAGLILMPRKVLAEEFKKSIKEIEKLSGISFKKKAEYVVDYAISHILTKRFAVSEQVVRIRLKRDSLI